MHPVHLYMEMKSIFLNEKALRAIYYHHMPLLSDAMRNGLSNIRNTMDLILTGYVISMYLEDGKTLMVHTLRLFQSL